MSHQVVTLTAQETAERLIPLLKEYAAKLAGISERAAKLWEQLGHTPNTAAQGLEIARVICLHDALDRPVAEIAQQASGLLEHAELEQVVWTELKLRLSELEEHIRFSKVLLGEVKKAFVGGNRNVVQHVRGLVEQTRYKAPF